MIEFETQRLQLRRFVDEDLASLFELTGDPDAMKWVGDNKPLSLERTRKWIENAKAGYQRRGLGCFAIVEKTTGDLIGYCGIVEPTPGASEIIYGFKSSAWGKGYGYEVASATMEHARNSYGLKKFVATVDPENSASIKIIERLGMKKIEERLDEHGLPEILFFREFE